MVEIQSKMPWLFTYYPRDIKETRSIREKKKDWDEGYANRESP